MGLPLKRTQKLQLIQNVAEPMLLNRPRCHHVMPLLGSCIDFQLFSQVQFKVLVFIYKVGFIYDLGPGYLKDSLPTQVSAWILQSSHQGLLRGHHWKKPIWRELGKVPFLWWPPSYGPLPKEAHSVSNLLIFLRLVKTELFRLAFTYVFREWWLFLNVFKCF